MYHLTTKRLSSLLVLSSLLFGQAAYGLLGSNPDARSQSHTAGGFTVSASDLFGTVIPAGPPTYAYTGTTGDGVVLVSFDGTNTLTITPIPGQLGTDRISVEGTDGSGTVGSWIDVTITNADPVLGALAPQVENEGDTVSFDASTSASDPDGPGDTLEYTLGGGSPAGASIDLNSGVFTWTTGEADGGFYTVTVIVTDDFGETANSDVDITINEVNEDPVIDPIADPTPSIAEQSLLAFTVSASDVDLPADTLTFSLVGAPTGASITAGGDFTWTPTEAQGPGSYPMTVQVSDGQGGLDSAAITVDVTEANIDPVLDPIADPTPSIAEQSLLAFTVSASDVDLPGNTLTFSLVGAPTGASITAGGDFTWTPTEAQGPGSYPMTIQVSDGQGGLDSAAITVDVTEANIDPVMDPIADPNPSIAEQSLLAFTVTASDADLPGNTLTFSLVGAPTGASITAGGDFTWTPTEAQGPGSYPMTIQVSDGQGGLDTAAITVDVTEVPVPPVLDPIADPSPTIAEEVAYAFTATASDVDVPASGLNFSLAPGAPPGAAINPGSGLFTWTPTEAQGPGSYAVTIQVTDGGGLQDSETINIDVTEVNIDPVMDPIADPTPSIAEESLLAFTVTASDVDLPANTLTFSLVGAPTGASITAGGDFTWTPTEAQGPGSYPMTIQVSDGQGGVDTAAITVDVTEANVDPVIDPIADPNPSIDEQSLLAFTVTASDVDLPANTLTFSLVGAPAGASITAGGDFTWTLTEAQGPGSYPMTVQISDGQGGVDTAPITVDVTEVNVDPVLDPIGDQTINEETLLSFTATATDVDDPANTLTFSLDPGAPAGASITAGGAFTWTPAEADGPGSFPVTVRVTDDGTPTLDDSETFTITVIEINDPPALIPGGDVPNQTMNEDDTTLFVEVRSQFDDPDLGDTPPDTLDVIVLPGYDAALIDVTVNGNGVDVTPLTHQYGFTTVTVGVQDGSLVQATDTFTVDVLSVNDPVQVAAGIPDQGAAEDVGTVSISLAGAFSDADLANGGDTHTVTFSSDDPSLLSAANSPLNDLSGTMIFNVEPDENGTATITVTAEDADGTQAVITFDLIIAEVTDPPFLDNPLPDVTYAEDPGVQTISLVGVFDDPDLSDGDVQIYSVVSTDPALVNPTIVGSNIDLAFGANLNGMATITVTVTDISAQTASDDFVVTVTAVNDDPIQVGPLPDINTAEDDPTTFTIDLATIFDDVDIATDADVLTFSMSNSNPALFDVETLVGSVVSLHLAPDQNGSATISVQATDSFGATASDSFDVNVSGVNDFPVAADDFVGPLNEDPGLIVIPVLDNDYLAEQPTIILNAGVAGASEGTPTIVLDAFDDPVALPNGTVTVNGNNIEYQPKDDFFGTDFFTYSIQDVDGDISPPATVTIQINQVNDPPVGVQQRTFSIYENQSLIVDAMEGVFTGSYDVDGALLDGTGTPVGSPLGAVLTVPPPLGSLSFDNTTGAFTFTPPINFTGEISFFYRLFDGIDVSSGAEYEVRVVVNTTPAAPPPPPPGTVAINYDISNIPLEQTNNVPPNVMVVLDDSGSMDWNMVVDSTDPNGKVVLNNRDARSSGSNSTSYVYLWNLPTNQYGYDNNNGRILPTEEGLDDDSNTDNNGYGVWRARNYKYNSIYYNPNVMYRPWIGQDVNNNDFTDAAINFGAGTSAIRLEPRDPTNTFDILAPHSYRSTRVPQWDSNGGRETIGDSPAQTVYIPRYYTTTEDAPLEWDDPHTLVEIRPANAPWPAANGREDCASDGVPATCSYEEELQNFANWFQYYRTREYVTKASLGRVISEVQDIRLGLETLNGSERERIRPMNELYTEGNKKLFLDDLYDTNSAGGTPLRDALRDTGEIFAGNGSYNPILPAPDGMCQQNFALLFSDGYWNGAAGVSGNADSNSVNDFDGGRYADSHSATLADTAMYYYKTDLQPTLDNEVPLSAADLDGAPSGTFGAGNNTMHQHMKTYTVAFGVEGSIDPTTIPTDPTVPFSWSDPFAGAPQKIDDMLHAAVNGRGRFLSASDSTALQASFEEAFLEFSQASSSTSAAAFNSTSLRDGTLLYRGFFDLRQNTGELTATVVNTDGSLAASPTWRASEMLNPANQLPTNRTLVTSDNVTGDGIPFRHPDLTPEQQLMMSFDEVEWIRGERSEEADNGGILRDRPTANGLLGDIVNSSPVFVGTPRAINRDQAPYPVDDLYSGFAAAQFSRRPIVYVGANDGILHGFDAQTGLETIGYLPSKNMDTTEIYHNDLEDVTSPFYQHKYYVDLTPSINDVYMRPSRAVTGKEWVTLLLGGLGAGGKGYFAFNVTDPDTQFTSEANATSAVLWEFTDEDDTYPISCPGQSETACPGNLLGGGGMLDPAGRPVKDLGVAMSQPTITMSNVTDGGSPANQKWVAVMGNGLNSTAGFAKLFVLFVNDGVDGWDPGDVVKIDTGVGPTGVPHPQAGYPNGLGTPTAVDVDLNGTVDWVYAGDRLGNLYRFDISDSNPDNWTSTRLFTAFYDDGGTPTVQPILSKPVVSKHPTEDGFLVTFGTGSHIAREDANSRDIQSIYTIWDRGESNPATAQPDTKSLRLVEQTLSNAVDDSVSPAQTRRILTSNQVDYISESGTPGTYGWYIDLDIPRASTTTSGSPNPDTSGLAPPDPQFPGEKAIRRMIFRDGTIIAATVLPSVGSTSCFGSRPGSILLFDALTGGNPVRSLVDFNNDGYVDDDDMIEVGGEDYAAGILFDQDALDGSLVDPSILGGEGDTDFLFISGGNETTSYRILDVNDNRTGRLSWQELD